MGSVFPVGLCGPSLLIVTKLVFNFSRTSQKSRLPSQQLILMHPSFHSTAQFNEFSDPFGSGHFR